MIVEIFKTEVGQNPILVFEATQEDEDSWDVSTYTGNTQTSFGTTDTEGMLAASSRVVRGANS